jgi:hypothetical protein
MRQSVMLFLKTFWMNMFLVHFVTSHCLGRISHVLHTSWSLSPKQYTCTILLNCWSNKFYYTSSQNNLMHGLISKVDTRIPIHKNTHNCLGDCNTKFVVVIVKGWVSCQLASIHLHPISTNFTVFFNKQLWNYWKDYQWSWGPCYDSC